jgi:hypothetical protein
MQFLGVKQQLLVRLISSQFLNFRGQKQVVEDNGLLLTEGVEPKIDRLTSAQQY